MCMHMRVWHDARMMTFKYISRYKNGASMSKVSTKVKLVLYAVNKAVK